MSPDLRGPAAYAAIVIAATLEGEVVFVAAATLVAQGHLNGAGVIFAGAAGASCGDQVAFHLLRGRLARWLNRFPAIARRGRSLTERVRRHETLAVLAIRFSPGLRVALAAACVYAGVPALKFGLLDAASSLVWALVLMVVVAWAGPAFLGGLGLSVWWGAMVPGFFIVLLARGEAKRARLTVDQYKS